MLKRPSLGRIKGAVGPIPGNYSPSTPRQKLKMTMKRMEQNTAKALWATNGEGILRVSLSNNQIRVKFVYDNPMFKPVNWNYTLRHKAKVNIIDNDNEE